MPTIRPDQIIPGDGVRVRKSHLSFLGWVVKIGRVNLTIASQVWGNPVEYKVRKDDCLGGQVDRDGKILDIVS